MEQCYALKPNNESAQLNLMMFHTQAPSIVGGDKSTARLLIDEISKTHPGRGLIMRAWLAVMEEDFDAASSFANSAIEANSDNTEALNVAGLIALQPNNILKLYRFLGVALHSTSKILIAIIKLEKRRILAATIQMMV